MAGLSRLVTSRYFSVRVTPLTVTVIKVAVGQQQHLRLQPGHQLVSQGGLTLAQRPGDRAHQPTAATGQQHQQPNLRHPDHGTVFAAVRWESLPIPTGVRHRDLGAIPRHYLQSERMRPAGPAAWSTRYSTAAASPDPGDTNEVKTPNPIRDNNRPTGENHPDDMTT